MRYRIRRLFLLPLLSGFLITLILLIINNGSLLPHVFYDYPISFEGAPASYLANRIPNGSYCNFRYGLPEQLLYEESDFIYPLETNSKSPYRILANVIEAKLNSVLPEVTYVSHATADFINYIAEIARFWEGPLSIAVFVPEFDADLTVKQLNQLCHCVPEMGRVSVHFVFPLKSLPYLQNHEERLTCEMPNSSKLSTFRKKHKMIYPINVCRNIARNYAQTDFVMVTDIQFIPSEELASRFIKMTKMLHIQKQNPPSRVFVVPIFEVEASEAIPRTKDELVFMVKNERAIFFHREICTHCQKFPGMKNWLESNPGKGVVKPFMSVKREYPLHRWEPIYIGSKDEPFYSETMSWEGLQDKMLQMKEMCLIGYQFVILDGAFLVHWPGIKRITKEFVDSRQKNADFYYQNVKEYKQIINELGKKYADNPKCKLNC